MNGIYVHYMENYPKDITADWVQKGLINSIDFNKEGDLEIISRQTDFLGINYYSRAIIRSEEYLKKKIFLLN